MKLWQHGVLLGGMLICLASCSDDNGFEGIEGAGGIRLSLRTSAEVAVSGPTRSEIPTLTAPGAESFSVKLTKSDNSYSKAWESIDDFNSEESFRTGTYTLEASSGAMEEEGFDKPYFHGAAEISVLEAKVTEASITATLANTMVSVDYTDGFKKYFKDYSVRVHSAGHSYVDFAADESRAAFVVPGEIDLTLTMTNPQGKTTSIQPAGFTGKARHHYRVTFDVEQGTGAAVLKIIFDDTLVAEDVSIDLTDALFSTPAPEVKASGFTPGSVIEVLEGTAPSENYVYTVVARGKMSEAKLTIDSDYTPTFGKEVDLIGASETVKQQIAASGINAVGFFKNPDKLGRLDVTNFVKGLPAGTHKITLVVKDAFTRVSEPITLIVTTEAISVEARAEDVVFGNSSVRVLIDYNGEDAAHAFSFKAMDKYGSFKDCAISEVKQNVKTRAFPSKNYAFTITLPDTERDVIPIQVYYHNVKKAELQTNVLTPNYDVEADAHSTFVVLKVNPEKASQLGAIVSALKVNVIASRSTRNGSFTLTRDAERGYVTVKGFTPSTGYTLTTQLSAEGEAKTSSSVTTEGATPLTNGDFGQSSETVNFNKVQVGGKFLVGAITYTVWSNITASEPTGWASVNSKTAYSGSTNHNTWYLVPSTMMDGDAVKLRSVAYDHNGAEIPRTGKFSSFTYYNPTAANPSSRAAGELFLGSYSFDGSEHRTDGINFGSRPASMTFDYKYAPYGSETGEAYITVLDASDAVIATKNIALSSSSDMKSTTVALPDYPFGKKASKLLLGFRSTKGSEIGVKIPSGSELNEGGGLNIDYKVATNGYKTLATGSVLTIDNVRLNY